MTEEEVEEEYLAYAEDLCQRYVGTVITVRNLTALEFECRDIERHLNHKFGYPGHMYEVLLLLDDRLGQLLMGYRLKSEPPEPLVLPLLGFFKRLLPRQEDN